ncbi:unnamed protein product [Prorocentrum cordatum]|uniref:Mechanosensitive ion channel protein n=1 Tax=Prorocentrum cordatum TaxID=2364126 RepID=A0ABN9TZA1_9DINO|nr:unnamed protein product [Polarella glacialis]
MCTFITPSFVTKCSFPSSFAVAFSFLLGDLLSNIFASFVLYLTQPFAQGDWVQSPDGKVDGWIQTVGWYYTTVMGWDKRPQYIPNSTFGFMPLVNCSRMTHRRIKIEGPLRMRDLDKVEEILKDVRNMVENHNDVDESMHRLCRLKSIDEYFVTLWVSCYTRSITLAKYLQIQESILLGICSILRRLLNARSLLLAHERDLEERQAALVDGRGTIEELEADVARLRTEAAAKEAGLQQHLELNRAREAAVERRRRALEAKYYAMERRGEALQKLQLSAEVFNIRPALAAKFQEEALQMRAQSVEVAWNSVAMEKEANMWEKESLEKEMALLERKRALGGSGAVLEAGPSVAATSPTAPSSEVEAGAAAEAGAPDAADAPAPAGGAAAEGAAAEEATGGAAGEALEADLSDIREQAAVAIGGE